VCFKIKERVIVRLSKRPVIPDDELLTAFLRSSPPPRFSREPVSGVEVLLTVPKLLATFNELPLLRWDNASNLDEK
jgi:hypothetical protein